MVSAGEEVGKAGAFCEPPGCRVPQIAVFTTAADMSDCEAVVIREGVLFSGKLWM